MKRVIAIIVAGVLAVGALFFVRSRQQHSLAPPA
jgi:hypothetical protein